MYLDISSMRKPSMGGRQHWVMLVDEATKYKKSFFLKKKNEQVEPIIDWLKALKARHKIQVKIIRCDNAGENNVLERESDKNELGIIFEYTAPGTPQQNGVVERAFVTVMGRTRAMISHAGFTMAKRQQFWCIRIKKIRLDNSTENRMLQAKSDQQNLRIKFEFTGPGT